MWIDLAINPIPKKRRDLFIVICNRLREIAEAQGAMFFNEEEITEETTIEDIALTREIKFVLWFNFPERRAELEAFVKGDPISKLLDLLGY